MTTIQKNFIAQYSDLFVSFFGVSSAVAEFIACQAALESSFGTSNLAKCNQNLFGMKLAKRRMTTAKPIPIDGFAHYSNNIMSCFDYCLWLTWNHFEQNILVDLDAFKSKLAACGYCLEPDYINKISNLLNSYKNE